MSSTPPAQPADPDPARLRASDDDRERVAAFLQRAVSEGRLTVHEVDERLASLYRARTVGELAPIVEDLPGHASVLAAAAAPAPTRASAGPTPVRPTGAAPSSRQVVAVLSGATRRGAWTVPELLHTTTILGGANFDLTEATFAAPVVTIKVFAVMGGVEIIVPDGVAVEVDGFALMGGFDNGVGDAAPPGAPVVRVTGFALMGGVSVRPPKRRRR